VAGCRILLRFRSIDIILGRAIGIINLWKFNVNLTGSDVQFYLTSMDSRSEVTETLGQMNRHLSNAHKTAKIEL
jgi:hypothetical protein